MAHVLRVVQVAVVVVLLPVIGIAILSRAFVVDLPPQSADCTSVQPVQFPSGPFPQKDRFEAVRAAIQHAWRGYKDIIPPHNKNNNTRSKYQDSCPDDLKPLSQQASQWLHASATLYDSLDTLFLAGLHDEFQDAVDMILQHPPYHHHVRDASSIRPTKTFEYSIRVLGGLLGAYSVSGSPQILALAIRTTDALLQGPFAQSPTALPRPFGVLPPPMYRHTSCLDPPCPCGLDSRSTAPGMTKHPSLKGTPSCSCSSTRRMLQGLLVASTCWIHAPFSFSYRTIPHTILQIWTIVYGIGRDAMGEHEFNSLAGVGSFALEFEFLSQMTLQPKYRRAADDIFQHVVRTIRSSGNPPGILPQTARVASSSFTTLPSNRWNVMTGSSMVGMKNLGSGSDSFYEYLVKVAMVKQDQDHLREEYIALYETVVRETLLSDDDNHRRHSVTQNYKIPKTYPTEGPRGQYHHLLCFIPGMLALGESQGITGNGRIMTLAQDLTDGCYDTYNRTKTGLGPEQIVIASNGYYAISNPGYYLRPELVESIFILFRTTGDERYQDMAWQIFLNIEKYCKVEHGYASLADVNVPSSHLDDMPSFFLGETLKYLLLTFAPTDYISLEDFVFTTEAHPLRRRHENENHVPPACYDLQNLLNPPIPIVLVIVSNAILWLLWFLVCWCCYYSWSLSRWCPWGFIPRRNRRRHLHHKVDKVL